MASWYGAFQHVKDPGFKPWLEYWDFFQRYFDSFVQYNMLYTLIYSIIYMLAIYHLGLVIWSVN